MSEPQLPIRGTDSCYVRGFPASMHVMRGYPDLGRGGWYSPTVQQPAPLLLLASLLSGCAACEDDAARLRIDVRSDFIPEYEAVAVAIEVDGSLRLEHSFSRADPLLEPGVRVGDVDLKPGSYRVTARLRGSEGILMQRTVLTRVEAGNTGITISLYRTCVAVDCPGPNDSPEATSCLGGFCVPEACTDGTQASCPQTPLCAVDGDCEAPLACGRARCGVGGCLVEDASDECGDGQFCVAEEGCRPVPNAEADSGSELGPDGAPGNRVEVDGTSALHADTAQLIFQHTIGEGPGRFLVVTSSIGSTAATTTAVTYDGVPLTRFGPNLQADALGPDCGSTYWYRVAPPVGPADVVITVEDMRTLIGTATSFFNVDASTPFGVPVSDVQNVERVAASLEVAGGASDLVLDVICTAAETPGTLEASSGQVVLQQLVDSTDEILHVGVGVSTGAAGLTTSWTFDSAIYNYFAVPLQASL